MSLHEEVENRIYDEVSVIDSDCELAAKQIITKVCDACIQAIQDNPHKSPIEAIADMRRKQPNEPKGEI